MNYFDYTTYDYIEYELEPKNQKSFYGKAIVRSYDEGTVKLLYSYDTPIVAKINGCIYPLFNDKQDELLSRTTMKHVNSFVDDKISKKDLLKLCSKITLDNIKDNIDKYAQVFIFDPDKEKFCYGVFLNYNEESHTLEFDDFIIKIEEEYIIYKIV